LGVNFRPTYFSLFFAAAPFNLLLQNGSSLEITFYGTFPFLKESTL